MPWSWMDDSHPFPFMSIGHRISEIKLFQTLTLKLQGQGHGCGQRARSYSWPSILFNSFPFHSTTIRPTIPKIQLFQKLTLKVMSEVKGQGHISYPVSVSNQCTSFSLHIHRTNYYWDMAKIVFDFEKTHPKFLKTFFFSTKLLSLYRTEKQIFAYLCHSRNLGPMPWKGHAVHFSRPIYSLSQISKI